MPMHQDAACFAGGGSGRCCVRRAHRPRPPAGTGANPDSACDAPGKIEYIDCPYESILMEHCFKCFTPDTEWQEMVVCDGWSEVEVRAQCASPVPLNVHAAGPPAGQ